MSRPDPHGSVKVFFFRDASAVSITDQRRFRGRMLTERGHGWSHCALRVVFLRVLDKSVPAGVILVTSRGARHVLFYRPISLRARWLLKENQRIVLAILVAPHLWSIVMTRFLRVAMTRGAVPVLICERSSRKVSSRTQWRLFSMPQCMRLSSSTRWGEALSGVKLVIPYAISRDSLFFLR